MPDMTDIIDIIAAHTLDSVMPLTLDTPNPEWIAECECDWTGTEPEHRMGEIAHAAHVAAALETAGYGKVVGVTEWGVEYLDPADDHVEDRDIFNEELDARNVHSNRRQTAYETTRVVCRTVTAWKKEA